MLLRFHQEGGARVARKGRRVLGMLAILDIRDRARLFGTAVANHEAAAFGWKLALGLGHDRVHRGAAQDDVCQGSSFILRRRNRSLARTSCVSVRLTPASSPRLSASSTILPLSALISVRPRCSRSKSIDGRWSYVEGSSRP